MLRLILRALAGCASIAAIALLASPASAELPMHPSLQTVRPDQSDMGPDPEAREEPAFGTAVVIRDELAFIGMPARSPGGRVGVYTATPTALFRTSTLTPSDPVLLGRFGR